MNATHVCPLKPLGHLVESPKNGALLFFGYHVTDGDTVKVIRDRGGGQFDCQSVRIAGVDTPEMRGSSELEKLAAKAVRAVVDDWLFDMDSNFLRVSYYSSDKYAGRFIGDIFDAREPSETLSGFLLGMGFARHYDGEQKDPWTEAELRQILIQAEPDRTTGQRKLERLRLVIASVQSALTQYEKELEV